MIIISILYKFRKNGLLILTLDIEIFTFITKLINVAIIGADVYCTTCKLKSAQVFAISMKNPEY